MAEAVNIPFYLNWQFWTAVVAVLALILSQLPPIYILFKRAKLEIELPFRVQVTHRIGNPNLFFNIIITNIGGRTVKIKGINTTVKRDGRLVATLPVQGYLQNPNDKAILLFTGISLRPNDEWAHIVNSFNFFSREDEKKFRDATSKIREEIFNKEKHWQIKRSLLKQMKCIANLFLICSKNTSRGNQASTRLKCL